MSNHTPGPWRYESGGGHAYNHIVGSDSVQVNGWPEPIGGVSNASHSDTVCENLGDTRLPGPAANARLIAAAPDLLEACKLATQYLGGVGGTLENKAAVRCREAIAKAEGQS